MIVSSLTRLKRRVRWPYKRLCQSLALPYASLRRWKHRLERGQPAIFKPGPQKAAPLKLEELRVHLYRLKHGRQRSRGVGRLYQQCQGQISRRDLQALTKTVRRELAHQHQAELRHIPWQLPGLVWSLDDAELTRFAHHQPHLHQVQDLASRYKFTPWGEIGSCEKAWPFGWSNCSCSMDRRSCSSATTVPISIIRPSMRCWPVIW